MVWAAPGVGARTTALLGALEDNQGIPAGALRHQIAEYPESVQGFFVCSWETEGIPGFLDAFRLIDLMENLGCRNLGVPTPDCLDPVCLVGRRRDGRGFRLEVTRGARNLDRPSLVRILKEELGDERATRTITIVRPRRRESTERRLSPRIEIEKTQTESEVPDLVLSGKLSQLPFPDLVQLLGAQRKTGGLRIGRAGRQVGAVYFKDGQVVHATFRGGYAGEPAFRRCAALTVAFFAFTTETPPVRSIRRPTPTVLMDAMRTIDEDGRA